MKLQLFAIFLLASSGWSHAVERGLKIQRDVAYGGLERQKGDCFLPETETGRAPVLLIHGGGWTAGSKETIEPFARVFAEAGHPVFSINYRLVGVAPWPACLEDCVAAARGLLEGKLMDGRPAPGKIVICGASAGGHLALMTGLRLGRDKVEKIISVAGPARLDNAYGTNDAVLFSPMFLKTFFGREEPSPDLVRSASPEFVVTSEAPPLQCVHSSNDQLVPLAHSEALVRAWRQAGGRAEISMFAGRDAFHGLWVDPNATPRVLVPEVVRLLQNSL